MGLCRMALAKLLFQGRANPFYQIGALPLSLLSLLIYLSFSSPHQSSCWFILLSLPLALNQLAYMFFGFASISTHPNINNLYCSSTCVACTLCPISSVYIRFEALQLLSILGFTIQKVIRVKYQSEVF